MDRKPHPDVVLMPELALTGYVSPQGDFDVSSWAEPLGGPTVAVFGALAREYDSLIIGPLVERAGTLFFNSLVGVAPSGELVVHYRKRHPWYPEHWATAGTTSGPLVHWRGIHMVCATCFDLHFLPDDAGALLDAADVLVFSSAWVSDGVDTRVSQLSTLARQHRVAILNANWGRGSPSVEGQGGSVSIDTTGEVVTQLGLGAERLDFEVTISKAATQS